MKRTIWTGVCSAIVGVAAAAMAAQTPSTSQAANQSSSEHRVTVTGCLVAAPSSGSDTATGTTGAGSTAVAGTTGTTGAGTTASGAAETNARFVLTNAKTSVAGAPGSDTAGTTATAGSTATGSGSAAASGTTAAEPTGTSGASGSATYRLIANPAALGPHVGKKLELTGTIENGSSASASTTAGAPDANAPTLRVESGKILASSCQQ